MAVAVAVYVIAAGVVIRHAMTVVVRRPLAPVAREAVSNEAAARAACQRSDQTAVRDDIANDAAAHRTENRPGGFRAFAGRAGARRSQRHTGCRKGCRN